MCLERITNGIPGFVAQCKVIIKLQVNKTFVFSEVARNRLDLLVTVITVAGKEWFESLQTTLSTQPIRENGIINSTIMKTGEALIAS
jgi:hypothetical protein